MIQYMKTVNNRLTKIDSPEDDCWISMINPTEQEMQQITQSVGALPHFLRAALDEEERSHTDSEDGQTLVTFDVPIMQEAKGTETEVFSTLPVGVVTLDKHIITVCLKEPSVLRDIAEGNMKNVQTAYKTQFLLLLLFRTATRFLQNLKQIDKLSAQIEQQLHKSMKNKELIQLLGLEKSLVYFSTSLKSDEATLERIARGRVIRLYDEDREILEDVLNEIKQAIEMASIYADVLTGTMDAFASVISNNLNIVMKLLASITILMTIPNIVFGFYGMNVTDLPIPQYVMPLIICAVTMAVTAIVLYKKNLL